jgi:carbonic anhydrase
MEAQPWRGGSQVDPSDVLGLKLGEGVVMRNIGGRITPAPPSRLVSGLVYDVNTGLIEIVDPAAGESCQ